MGQAKFIVTLAFIAIFILSVTTYVMNFASDNDVGISFDDDGDLIQMNQSVTGNLKAFQSGANDSSKSFFLTEESDETLKTPGQFNFSTSSGIGAVTDGVTFGFRKIFGSGGAFALLLGTFVSLIAILSLMYIWKTLKGGNPD